MSRFVYNQQYGKYSSPSLEVAVAMCSRNRLGSTHTIRSIGRNSSTSNTGVLPVMGMAVRNTGNDGSSSSSGGGADPVA